MAPKISLIRSDSGLPSDRAGLVAALQAAEAAKAVLTKHGAAIGRVRSQVYGMDGRIEMAGAKITEERTAHAHALASAATEDALAPPSGVRAARQALTELQDERDAVKIALDDLKAQLPDIELAAKQADADVDTEINKILQPLAVDLISRERRLTAEIAALRGSLASLFRANEIPHTEYDYRIKRSTVADLVRSEFERELENLLPVGADVWRATRAALRRDPNAPLPAIADVASEGRAA
jgi:hypothetical protein